MKHTIDDLDGVLLDAAVARAAGKTVVAMEGGGIAEVIAGRDIYAFRPSTHWHDGGPIIERERIAVMPDDYQQWSAGWRCSSDEGDELLEGFRRVAGDCWQAGPTPLVAAMRAYVVSKFGDEIELP